MRDVVIVRRISCLADLPPQLLAHHHVAEAAGRHDHGVPSIPLYSFKTEFDAQGGMSSTSQRQIKGKKVRFYDHDQLNFVINDAGRLYSS